VSRTRSSVQRLEGGLGTRCGMRHSDFLAIAKKEREKEEERSCLVSLHQTIIRMQNILTIPLNRVSYNFNIS
jgi:hypothetical protein